MTLLTAVIVSTGEKEIRQLSVKVRRVLNLRVLGLNYNPSMTFTVLFSIVISISTVSYHHHYGRPESSVHVLQSRPRGTRWEWRINRAI